MGEGECSKSQELEKNIILMLNSIHAEFVVSTNYWVVVIFTEAMFMLKINNSTVIIVPLKWIAT